MQQQNVSAGKAAEGVKMMKQHTINVQCDAMQMHGAINVYSSQA